MPNLLIVESPKKAKTIGAYLGDEWRVRYSLGHVRDLPGNPKDGIGIDLETFEPKYETLKPDVVKGLRSAAKGAGTILLATDGDREGEAIAAHLSELLNVHGECRVRFNAITPDTIKAAMADPVAIDTRLVAAQEARRVLDRIIGYRVSPQLGSGQSAGRVQSPALRLVVDREREIAVFRPTSHFGVRATDAQQRFTADWDTRPLLSDEHRYITDQALADRIAGTTTLTVRSTTQRKRRSHPPKPFTTSTLQQAASSRLGLSPKDTMAAAQSLYDSGEITYMRTDSTRIDASEVSNIRAYLTSVGVDLPDTPPNLEATKNAQDAHECVRPTNIANKRGGDDATTLDVYRLIRARTLASQMTSAVFEVTEAAFDGNTAVDDDGTPALFRAKGETRIHEGWMRAMTEDPEDDDETDKSQAPLPPMREGEVINVSCARLDKKTQAPPRYTEASLVKALEDRGIGRPSTYAAILDGLRRRSYMKLKKRKLHPTDDGCALIDTLRACHFSFLSDDYTSAMESSLDAVASGDAGYRGVVESGYRQLESEMAALMAPSDDMLGCPECGAAMRRIETKKGTFWGCRGFPDCKGTRPDNDGMPGEKPDISTQDMNAPVCPECGKPMRQRTASKGKSKGQSFWGCSGYPSCSHTQPVTQE